LTDDKTEKWGVSVTSVEIRDVAIPEALQEAMPRQAQERGTTVLIPTSMVDSLNPGVGSCAGRPSSIWSGKPAQNCRIRR